ncbi:hypothetical protein KAU33_13835, partial [Candidatus Dependentiae bacterium]|nr:hypothetical protein [Candidatus Dependentiae bacterium]
VNGVLDIHHGWLGQTEETRTWRDTLLNKLKETSEKIKKEFKHTTSRQHLNITPEIWTPEVDKIIEILKLMI